MYTEYYTINYKPKRLAKKSKKRRSATFKADCFYGICILVVIAITLAFNAILDSNTNKALAAEEPSTVSPTIVVASTPKAAAVKLSNITTFKIEEPAIPMAEEPVPMVEEIAPIVEPEPASSTSYANCIAMPSSHQDFVLDNAEAYNIPEELGFSIIWKESTYRSNVYSNTNDAGYMQINACNYNGLNRLIGFDPSNPCDPAMNIQGGFYLLREMMDMYNPDSWHSLLMIYNMGYDTAKSLWAQGIYSSQYSRDVLGYCEENFGALGDINDYK